MCQIGSKVLMSFSFCQVILLALKKSEKIKLRLSEFCQYCHHRLIFASRIDDFPNQLHFFRFLTRAVE